MPAALATRKVLPAQTGTNQTWDQLRATGRAMPVMRTRCARCNGRISKDRKAIYLGHRYGHGTTVVHLTDEQCLRSSGCYTQCMIEKDLDDID